MRKIAIVTASRAEYGLLKPLITSVNNSHDFSLKLLVTGMHLMPEHGNTYLQILKDGFQIDAKIYDGLDGDDAIAISKALSKATFGFAETYQKFKPDLLIVLGDRIELLAAVSAAIVANLPVAHIHGGETTEGAYDEFVRHAITKMSHLHFASCKVYRNRIIQLGERPNSVFNVGAIGVDSIKKLKLLNREQLEESVGIKFKESLIIITFHPVTLENNSAKEQFENLLEVVDGLNNFTLIFTKPNSDKGSAVINSLIDRYAKKNSNKAIAFDSMGQLRYLSAIKHADFVIGNSSSGILEVPYFNKPTINIGVRQKGRIAPASVINCEPNKVDIFKAVQKAQSYNFKKAISNQDQIYGDGTATEKIMAVIRSNKDINLQKSFYDLNSNCFEKL